ncbi:SDR family NAD(P)-dependent oxidoreductase [Planctomycetota bacterium]
MTGGTGIIGGEVARLLQEKFKVIISGTRSEGDSPAQYTYFPADIRNPQSVSLLRDQIQDVCGGVPECLAHCAGITLAQPMAAITPEAWDQVWEVNYQGTANIIEAFAPLMAARGSGSIVVMSSRAGLEGRAGLAAYAAAKGAVLGLVRTAAERFGPKGVRVNSVLPGYIPGGMAPAGGPAGETALNRSILKRFTGAVDAARFIVEVLDNPSLTGQTLTIDSR